MGVLLLADQEDALSLSLGLFGAIVSAVIGAILLISGIDDEPGAAELTQAASTAPRPRLTRDRSNAIVAGVCAGLARRLGVDPVLVRVGFVLAVIVTAGGALGAYVLAWIFIEPGGAEPGPEPGEPGRGGCSRACRSATGGWPPASAFSPCRACWSCGSSASGGPTRSCGR